MKPYSDDDVTAAEAATRGVERLIVQIQRLEFVMEDNRISLGRLSLALRAGQPWYRLLWMDTKAGYRRAKRKLAMFRP